METNKLIQELANKKAEEDNQIDLHSYYLGLQDALNHSEVQKIISVLKKAYPLLIERHLYATGNEVKELYEYLKTE